MVYEEPTFFIKGGDVGFADRQKRIFNTLIVEEKNRNERQEESDHYNDNTLPAMNTVQSRKRCRSETKQYRGKESIFKRPDAPPPRFKNKNVPDYHRNPHKWIKYSLGDVSQEDMSDQSNTAAALSFLKEMKERKRPNEMEVDDIVPDQITFKEPVSVGGVLSQQGTSRIFAGTRGDSANEDAKACFQSSKLIMPEYIIGMTKKKDKKKHEKLDHFPQNENITSKIKLQHLTEEDDSE
jgi:hypothetical protein